MRKLTTKQRRFCEAVAAGSSYSRAYRDIYSSRGSRLTTNSEASRLANLPKMTAEIKVLTTPIQELVNQSLIELCRYGNDDIRLKAVKELIQLNRLLKV